MHRGTLVPPPLRTEVLTQAGELERLASTFDALLASEEDNHAFRQFAWVWPWWKAFGTGRALRVLVAREANAIRGVLPLYEERLAGPAGLGRRRLAFVGAGPGAAEDLGVVAGPTDEARLADVFAAALGAQVPFDELALDAVRPGSALARAIEGRFGTASGHAVRSDAQVVSPRGGLDGTFDDYLAGRPGGLAAQVRRRARWLDRQPGYRVVRVAAPSEVGPAFDSLVDLHRMRFGTRSTTFDGPMFGFLREVAGRLAASGRLRLVTMWATGAPVAAVLGWRWGKTFAYYQSGHHPDWRDRSVGTVLIAECLRDSFAEGLATWDFLRGDEPYKRAWVDGERRYLNVRVRGPALAARLAEAGRVARAAAGGLARHILTR